MLLRNLKKIASECCFNPKKPSKSEKITLDVGNPTYWTVRAMEHIQMAQSLSEGSEFYNKCIQEATSLLILTRAYIDDRVKESKKT